MESEKPQQQKDTKSLKERLIKQFNRHWVNLVCGLVGVFLGNLPHISHTLLIIDQQSRPPNYFLYSSDFSHKQYIIEEPLKLIETSLSNGLIELKGQSKTKVQDHSEEYIEKTFYYSGFKTNDRIVLSYTSNHHGAGTYYFRLSGNDWIGTWLGKEQNNLGTVKGSAALTQKSVGDEEALKKRFPTLAEKPEIIP